MGRKDGGRERRMGGREGGGEREEGEGGGRGGWGEAEKTRRRAAVPEPERARDATREGLVRTVEVWEGPYLETESTAKVLASVVPAGSRRGAREARNAFSPAPPAEAGGRRWRGTVLVGPKRSAEPSQSLSPPSLPPPSLHASNTALLTLQNTTPSPSHLLHSTRVSPAVRWKETKKTTGGEEGGWKVHFREVLEEVVRIDRLGGGGGGGVREGGLGGVETNWYGGFVWT